MEITKAVVLPCIISYVLGVITAISLARGSATPSEQLPRGALVEPQHLEGSDAGDPCGKCKVLWPLNDTASGTVSLSLEETRQVEAAASARNTGPKFRYPDGMDGSMDEWAKLFKGSEKGSGAIEQDYWSNLEIEFGARRGGVMLDAGAGMGRLTMKYASLFRKVVAVEPDVLRFSYADFVVQKFVAKPERVTMVHGYLDDLKNLDHTFDVAVSSHIVQHIPIAVAKAYFRSIRRLLKPDGVFIIATTHVPAAGYGFNLKGSEISEEKFNMAAHDGTMGTPVRRFSRDRLESELIEAGFSIKRWFPFTFIMPEKVGFFAKKNKVSHDAMREAPVSQGIVASPLAV